jgi:WD40 repeat protein
LFYFTCKGDDAGIVQIWSLSTKIPWKLIYTLKLEVDGKIRTFGWHSSSLFLGAAGIRFGFTVWDVNRNWTNTAIEPWSTTLPPPPQDSFVHYMDWSPSNEFVVDTTIYELYHTPQQQQQQSQGQFNIFNHQSNVTTNPMVGRAITVLGACRLCTLSQWSPNGEYIATAFGATISISQRMNNHDSSNSSIGGNETDLEKDVYWVSVYNLTTVEDTYMIISAMSWSPDGKYLAVGGAGNNNLFLYDCTNWTIPPLLVSTSTQFGIDSLSWRPDSQQIAIGTSRIIEIRELQYEDSINTIPNSTYPKTIYPSSAPTESNILYNDSSLGQSNSDIGIAGMVGIGITAVMVSFACAIFILVRRMKLISKRKSASTNKGGMPSNDRNGFYDVVENTTSDDDVHSRTISIPLKLDC